MKKSKKKQRPRELSEGEAFQIALNDHPDYRRLWEKNELPEEMEDEHGNLMSPRMHLLVHQIVERQLASDQPRGVAAIERRLLRLLVDRHTIRHIIGQAVTEEIFHVGKEHRPFDEERYMQRLEDLVAEYE